MGNIPVAVKFILNLIFFSIYSLIGIIFGNFIFGIVMLFLGKGIPGSNDPIHLKLAVLVVIIISILTIVLRKYFYISLESGNIEKKEKKIIPPPAGTPFEKGRNKEDEIKVVKEEKNIEEDGGLKIYIDKEIK